MATVKVLFIGDIIGRIGRRVVRHFLPGIKAERSVDVTIANGENAAGGFGLTPETAAELFDIGVDVITTGNHVWDKKEIIPFFRERPDIIRPMNFPEGVPGRGSVRLENVIDIPFWVVNIQGKVMMPPIACPFLAMESFLKSLPPSEKLIVVDFHAEATSEKKAMGYCLDGRVSLLLGTHTHVATRDLEILKGGTGYISDVGMTGPYDSVIGMKKEGSIERIVTGMPNVLEVAKGRPALSAVFAELDASTGRCLSVEYISRELKAG
ncbi:MAG TPA: TIGR00282 family metallophosphoesterase [Acidobacteriota bacterium]|nr:TIGR00282 family metallophosphoesterase [Acidobacteriota bacterium]HNT16539.1 TIGR00282 family metallophosphoesterase [Acidobacteriota bacterium]HPA26051.1 TIGR00282 family metallophosphoesterase [Acidobacteriota bacterium]HQO19014.1 TIGR00282 family metallophosphoesterase [Acidobacteriota bacterium]HQQ45907.1 TIGR00282 family metallophosphoesterase [Acidobacteriota bacterium]